MLGRVVGLRMRPRARPSSGPLSFAKISVLWPCMTLVNILSQEIARWTRNRRNMRLSATRTIFWTRDKREEFTSKIQRFKQHVASLSVSFARRTERCGVLCEIGRTRRGGGGKHSLLTFLLRSKDFEPHVSSTHIPLAQCHQTF